MYFAKTPGILSSFYGNLIWEVKTGKKIIYLTFDDGPDEEVTPQVLDILDEYEAKATFFCLGKNVETLKEITQRISRAGHTIGNHSYSHKNGFKTGLHDYLEDIDKAQKILNSGLFRPPYGRIWKTQAKALSAEYKIIMWTVLSGDFDRKTGKEKCLKNSVKHTKCGTIIVFHDSQKAKENVLYTLPRYLKHFSELGYSFEALHSGLFE